jgi:isoleucyl-tRNA synthetase
MKDRLYTEAAGSPSRRCAQTVMYVILHILVKTLAPILVVTMDEVWQLMRQAGWVAELSVHASAWPSLPAIEGLEQELARWAPILAIRGVVMKAMESQRAAAVIGSPLDAKVTLLIRDPQLFSMASAVSELLAEAFVVSQVSVAQPQGDDRDASTEVAGLAAVRVERAPGSKCERCWKHLPSVGKDAKHPGLCDRCVRVVAEWSGEQVEKTNA